jgi:hypothetical protein
MRHRPEFGSESKKNAKVQAITATAKNAQYLNATVKTKT